MALPYQPWRAAYQPASYGGAEFHVEVDSQAGGRRNALHEFPHRDEPWAEDMGRRARRWSVSAYCVGPDYTDDRDALIAACETEGPQTLVHPLLGEVQANCDEYVCVERRELGGYAAFDLRFCEAGSQPGLTATADTQSQATAAASNLGNASAQSLNTTASGAPASTGATIDNGPGGGAGFGGGSGGSPFSGPRA